MSAPFLSIVIPAYNEEHRLPQTLDDIGRFLRQQNFRSEIIVVENGSSDDTSGVVVRYGQSLDPTDPFLVRLAHSAPGKGAAVKTGMLLGSGELLFICDADLSMPIEELAKFLPPLAASGSYDIAIASREIPGSVRHNEPFYRHIMGRVFNFIVRTLLIPGIEDTQCGFKCFTRQSARELFAHQTIDGWGFDPEVLYIARLREMKIIEIPINWYFMSESRVNPVRDTLSMLRDVLQIRRNGQRAIYSEVKNPLSEEGVA